MVKGIPQGALRMGGAAVACLGVVVALTVGSVRDDADAARRPLLKTLWAVVDANGTLVRGKGAVSSNGGGGAYGVFFNRDVSRCAYAATIGTRDVPAVLTATSAGAVGKPKVVEVFTLKTDFTRVGMAFHLVVHC